MTVARQLLFPAGAEVLVARHWLDRLGLSSLEERLPAALSLGQQQRVALARALVRPAILLLLDEPLSALDAPLRRRLREELRQLQHVRKSSRPFHAEVSSSMIAALFLIETAKSELEEAGLPQAEAVSKASDILAETTQKIAADPADQDEVRPAKFRMRGKLLLPAGCSFRAIPCCVDQ